MGLRSSTIPINRILKSILSDLDEKVSRNASVNFSGLGSFSL